MNLLASVNMPAKHKPAQQRTPKHGKNGKGHSLDPETAKRTYHSWTCADLDTEQEKQKPYKNVMARDTAERPRPRNRRPTATPNSIIKMTVNIGMCDITLW